MRNKSLLITVISFLIGLSVIGGGVFVWYQNRPHEVKVIYRSGENDLVVDVFSNVIEVDHVMTYEKPQEPLATFDNTKTISLKKGTYLAVSRPNKDYQKINQVFQVKKSGNKLVIEAAYSKSKLARELAAQEQAIRQAVESEITGLDTYYFLKYEAYLDATWAGAILAPKDYQNIAINKRDFLRVVLRKEKDEWVVKTMPEIVLGVPSYPDIPRSILDEINQIQTDPAPQIR